MSAQSSLDQSRTDLVYGQHLPLNVRQLFRIPERQLIRGKKNVHLQTFVRLAKFVGADDLTSTSRSYISDDVQVGCPSSKLGLPSSDGR